MYKKISITIPLKPITKKNSQQILVNRSTGRPFIAPSKQYKQYEKDAGYFIKPKGLKIDYPVNVKCLYYMPTHRKVDLTNLLNATLDMLCFYDIIKDDNRNIVYSVDGSKVLFDKENPRTEIIITAIDGAETWGRK